MRLSRFASLLATGLLAGACAGQPDSADVTARVTELADSAWATYLAVDPEAGTQLGIAGAPHDRLTSNRPADIAAARARWDRLRGAVDSIDGSGLAGGRTWALHGILREMLASEYETRVCRQELWGVASYVNGWQARFTDLAVIQPVGNDSLRGQALARAAAIAPWLDQEVANLREGLAQGYSSPQVIVRAVLRQVDDLRRTPVRQSPFYSPAQRDTSRAFGDSLAAIVAGSVLPALGRYRDFLEREYLPRARTALGVTSNPDGARCYAAVIRSFASVPMPADSVYQTGLAEMARVEGEMREIAARSFGGESLPSLMIRLRTDPRYTFRTSEEVIDSAGAILGRAKAAMGQWFGRLPKADMIIQPYPEFRQRAGAPGQYQAAPEDGSRPAIFLINPSDPTHKPRADGANVALHEGIPGHHLQIAIAREVEGAHPLARNWFSSGFGEGWALYAERLGDEMGLYANDLERFGMLGSEAFRAARMVIDAGIHTRGWTREQAVDYMRSHTVVAARTIEGEIDRYISWPGQAPSYMIGRNEILRLREQARSALGDRFDIRAFHDRVLENGGVPLSQLRDQVNRWIAGTTP